MVRRCQFEGKSNIKSKIGVGRVHIAVACAQGKIACIQFLDAQVLNVLKLASTVKRCQPRISPSCVSKDFTCDATHRMRQTNRDVKHITRCRVAKLGGAL